MILGVEDEEILEELVALRLLWDGAFPLTEAI